MKSGFQKINAFKLKRIVKIILLLLAVLISIFTLVLSQKLVSKIAAEETKKMQIWADAEHILSDPNSEGDLGFHLAIIQSNTTIPAILVSETGRVIQHINLEKSDKPKDKISEAILKSKIEEFKLENEPIDIPIDEKTVFKVYYGKSTVLKQLAYYPYVVLGIVALFMLVSYFAFSYSTRSEQNQVWVGLAKETAHQLGTPISSLMGWVECLEMDIIPENYKMGAIFLQSIGAFTNIDDLLAGTFNTSEELYNRLIRDTDSDLKSASERVKCFKHLEGFKEMPPDKKQLALVNFEKCIGKTLPNKNNLPPKDDPQPVKTTPGAYTNDETSFIQYLKTITKEYEEGSYSEDGKGGQDNKGEWYMFKATPPGTDKGNFEPIK